MNRSFVALLVAAALLPAGCAEILNTHSSGTGPAGPGSIPGPPAGDSVEAVGDIIFNAGNITLSSHDASPTLVDLIPTGQNQAADEYLVNFRGVMTLITPLPFIAVDLYDTAGRPACGLEIGGGEFRLVSSAGTQAIGTYTGAADEHRILLRASRTGHRCLVNIRQVAQGAGENAPLTQPAIDASGDFVDVAFGALGRMRVAWEQGSPENPKNYFLGPVVISRSE